MLARARGAGRRGRPTTAPAARILTRLQPRRCAIGGEPPSVAGREADGDSYWTLEAPATAEVRVLRSRFLAEAGPAASEADARRAVADAQRRHHDSRHVAFAWCGGGPAARQEWRGDGGEPAGTAGEPILAALRAAAVHDAVVVVARWFGGVKLGTGGLARAYHAAAAAALARAPRRRVTPGAEGAVTFPYAWERTVARLLARHAGRTVSEDYGECVRWRIWLPLGAWRTFGAEVADATAGAARVEAPA